MSLTNRFVETSHGRLAVTESAGAGPPLLLIHGNSACKEIFRHQLDGKVGRDYRAIAFDLPGHGASDDARRPEQSYGMDGYADAAVELLRLMGAEDAAVLGWSLGGHVGIEMIARLPRMRGLLITGTPPVGKSAEAVGKGFIQSPELALAGREALSDREARTYARMMTAKGEVEPFLLTSVRRTDGRARRLMFEAFLAGRGVDQRGVVEASRMPLAVVSGAAEHFVDNRYLGTIGYANLWEGVVFILPGAGHAPFWEAPAVFDPILLRFLAALRQ